MLLCDLGEFGLQNRVSARECSMCECAFSSMYVRLLAGIRANPQDVIVCGSRRECLARSQWWWLIVAVRQPTAIHADYVENGLRSDVLPFQACAIDVIR